MKKWVRVSDEEISQIWRRRGEGQSPNEIALALGRTHSTIVDVINRSGGFPAPVRRRSARVLSLAQREEISRGLCLGLSCRQIARCIARAPSTVCREIARHGGARHYRAAGADSQAWQWARRPKECLLSAHQGLQGVVSEKLQLQWSPQQISLWLELEFPNDDTMRVSHETIYRSLFIQARGALKKQLIEHLRSRRSARAPKVRTGRKRGQILNALSIRQRPAQLEDRAIPGHWEGDLLCGGRNTQIATLVERHSRFVMLVKLAGKDTHTVVSALTEQALKLPQQLRGSLTWDRGLELAAHERFTLDTQMQVYFCDPHSPWQRGSNENTNGLLRQYFPKGALLSGYSQAYLDAVALRLNQRPRKTLGYLTPADKLHATVALTG